MKTTGIGLALIAFCASLAVNSDALTDNYQAVTQNRLVINQYIRMYNPGISSANSWLIADQLAGAGNFHQVDPKFVAAIIAVESKFNNRAYNHGAAGLGQLMPGTARTLGIKDPYSITDNVFGTTKYVRNQYDYFGVGTTENFVLASYLQGPNRVKRQQGRFPSRVYSYIRSVMTHYDALKNMFKTIPIEAPAIASVSSGNEIVSISTPNVQNTVATIAPSPIESSKNAIESNDLQY